MPDPNDERNREREFRFELTIFVKDGRISGAFKNLTAKTPLTRITKGECRNGLCCFEVPDDPAEGMDVNTWCVSSQGDALVGSRNGGAMTPSGSGIGARFFPVKARRVPKPKPAPHSVSP
jgi:hypothetical protein